MPRQLISYSQGFFVLSLCPDVLLFSLVLMSVCMFLGISMVYLAISGQKASEGGARGEERDSSGGLADEKGGGGVNYSRVCGSGFNLGQFFTEHGCVQSGSGDLEPILVLLPIRLFISCSIAFIYPPISNSLCIHLSACLYTHLSLFVSFP